MALANGDDGAKEFLQLCLFLGTGHSVQQEYMGATEENVVADTREWRAGIFPSSMIVPRISLGRSSSLEAFRVDIA